MEHTSIVKYDRALVKKALNAYMRNALGNLSLFCFVAVLLILYFAYWSNAWSSLHTALAIIMFVLVLTVIFIYYIRLKASDVFLRKSKDAVVKFIFSEEGVKGDTDVSSVEMKWALVDGVLKFKDFWLLIYARSGYYTLPKASMSDECQQFIEAQIIKSKKERGK